jgi:DNA-binding IscR family transcriptional regulator
MIITYLTGNIMSVKSVQFTVAAHIMAALGFYHREEISSAILSDSVNADPTFVRKSLSKLSKAGLAFAIHSYPVDKRCPVSRNLKECMSLVLSETQNRFEESLAKITLADLVGQIREKLH